MSEFRREHGLTPEEERLAVNVTEAEFWAMYGRGMLDELEYQQGKEALQKLGLDGMEVPDE